MQSPGVGRPRRTLAPVGRELPRGARPMALRGGRLTLPTPLRPLGRVLRRGRRGGLLARVADAAAIPLGPPLRERRRPSASLTRWRGNILTRLESL